MIAITHAVNRCERLCEVDGCEEPFRAQHFCARHYMSWVRHGDPLGGRTIGGDKITYSGLHMRLRRKFGPASIYLCSCGEPAKDWAYLGSDQERVYQRPGRAPLVYSPDLLAYQPRCRSHHLAMDARTRAAAK